MISRVELVQKCDRYAKRHNCTYDIQNSLTTNSVYIHFRFIEDNHKISIRLSDHPQFKTRISTVKHNAVSVDRILKRKFKAYSIFKTKSLINKINKGVLH